MWFAASYLRIQASLIFGFSLWIAAIADNRVLLEPEYSLHQRPPTDEGEPLLIQVACRIFLLPAAYFLSLLILLLFLGEHQPAEYPGSEGEGAVGQP